MSEDPLPAGVLGTSWKNTRRSAHHLHLKRAGHLTQAGGAEAEGGVRLARVRTPLLGYSEPSTGLHTLGEEA